MIIVTILFNDQKDHPATFDQIFIPSFCHHHQVEPKWYTNTQQHKWGVTFTIDEALTGWFLPIFSAWDESCPFLVCCPVLSLSAFTELCRKSQSSPFRAWSSASFSDIRVCLCGWVMDLLCWYVLLWRLQKPVKWLRICHTEDSLFQNDFQEVALCTANTPSSTYPPAVNLTVPLDPVAAPQNQIKSPGPKQEGFKGIWNMYFSLLVIVCIFLWNNASENPHFPFLLGTAKLGKWGEILVMSWFFLQNTDFLWCVSKQSAQSKKRCPTWAALLVWFCPLSVHNSLSSFMLEKMCCRFPTCNIL